MAEDKNRPDQSQGEIVIYQAEDGLTRVKCRFVNETVWLTQQQMAGVNPRFCVNSILGANRADLFWGAAGESGCHLFTT